MKLYKSLVTPHEAASGERVWKLSQKGKFRTLFVKYPELPDVFEFIARWDHGITRYINVDAKPGANISRIIE